MKISNIGVMPHNKTNFKAHIVLADQPELTEVINQSTKYVGKEKMKRVLDEFQKEAPYVPVEFSVRKSKFHHCCSEEMEFIVAKNLKNGEIAERNIYMDDSFYSFVVDLMNDRKYYDFWTKPEVKKPKDIDILEHDVFITADNFDIEKYDKDFQDKENFIDEAGVRALATFVKALETDRDLRVIIGDIAESRIPKPITEEKLRQFRDAYSDLCRSMRGKGWLK